MSATNIRNTLVTRKGQFSRAAWVRQCKVRKGSPAIFKSTVKTVRAGITYDNMAVVKEKRESGELPKENMGLMFGQWSIYPYLIEHNGEEYARLYPDVGNANTEVQFLMNGVQIPYDLAEPHLLASEKRTEEPICITVKLKDIVELY